MPLELERVHVYARHEGPDGEVAQRLVEYNPFLRLSGGVDAAPVFIQNGVAYGEGGDELSADALPDWFDGQIARCSDAALIAVGWKEADPLTPSLAPNPPVYTDRKTDLLSQLASLGEAQLERLLQGAREPMAPDQNAAAYRQPEHIGTPATDVRDIDADDFPPDPEDELLPAIPQDHTEDSWTCPECGETMNARQRGAHVRWNHPRKDANGEPPIQPRSESLRPG